MYSKPTDLSIELPNGGVGPDPLRIGELDAEFVVLLFQRDYLCGNCRNQVQDVAARYDAFRERNSVVISVLPESKERAAEWATNYELPFPVVADPDTAVADRFGQPVRFGFIGDLHNLLGRMPLAVIIDLRTDKPRLIYSHVGNSPSDRPTIEGLLLELDHHRKSSA